MTNPIDYDIPCDNCIIFPQCINPERFFATFYECACPMLEKWITNFNEKHKMKNEIKGTYAVVDWYEARTGFKL